MRHPVLFVAFLLLLSGCGGPSGPSTPSAPPNVSVSDQSIDGEPAGFPYSDGGSNGTFRTLNVGDLSTTSFDGSVTVYVWNARAERQELNVTLTYGPGNTTLYRRAVEFPGNETLRLRMGRSGLYTFTVRSANGSGTLTLSRDDFDCNDRSYAFRVNRTGSVDQQVVSTELLCSSDG